MTVTRETLMAFVDGELAPDEERRVAAEVAKDPALGLYVEQQKQLSAKLKHAFAPVLEQKVPERIEQTIRETKPLPPPLASRLRRIWRERALQAGRGFIPAGALAAGLLLGFALDGWFQNADFRTEDGALVARGELARVLTIGLASEQEDAPGAARIGVTFRNRDGAFCRSFATSPSARGASAGIACLDSGDWLIVVLAAAAPAVSGEFSTAAGEMPAIVRNALSAMIAGEPLDAQQERAARDQGW